MDEREQYSSYLDREGKNFSRFMQSEDERTDMPFYQKAVLGAGAAALGLAIAHRTGGVKHLANFIQTEVKGTYQATREILNEQGSLWHNLNLSRFREDLATRRREIVTERKQQMQEFGRIREYDMQRYVKQMNQLVDKEVPHYINEELRFQAVYKDLINEIGQHRADLVSRALSKGQTGFLGYADNKVIKYHLNNAEIRDDATIDAVLRARAAHQNTDFTKTQEGIAWVESMQERLRQYTSGQIGTLTKKDGAVKSAIRGHKQATVNDVLEMHSAGTINVDPDTVAQLNDILSRNQKFGQSVFDENLYVNMKDGKPAGLIDYKPFNEIKNQQLDFWANSIPGRLMHLRDGINIREAKENASFHMFGRGTVQPSLNAQRGIENNEQLNEALVYVNGKFVRLFDTSEDGLDILNKKRDMFLTSARFGTLAKMHKAVAGLETEQVERGMFRELFDLGNQDKPNDFAQTASIATKLFNPNWERNIMRKAFQEDVKYDDYFRIEKYFKKYTEGLTPRTMHNLQGYFNPETREFIADNNINFSRQEDMLKLFENVAQQQGANKSLKRMHKQYERDPYGFLNSKQPVGETDFISGQYTRIQTGYDRIQQEMGLELIRQMHTRNMQGTPFDARNVIDGLHGQGKILLDDARKADWLISYYQFHRDSKMIFNTPDIELGKINRLFKGTGAEVEGFQQSMRLMMSQKNPYFEKFVDEPIVNRIEHDYIAVNKSNFWNNMKTLSGWRDITTQLGMTTGRRNIEDFTSLSASSMFIPYRLQDALGNMGLGLSNDSMGSPLQLWSSILLKRFLPAYAGYEAYQYADYKMDDWTGMGFSERIENHKARLALQDAAAREWFGSNDMIKREQMLQPGSEQFAQMPWGIRSIIASTAGIASGQPVDYYDPKDSYTGEELYDYYQSGTDEIRKGRWWSAGSKSAYRGDRITEFAPNSYRQAMSDWEYTNVTETGEEKWSHSFFPTLENPLGFMSDVLGITDPYWYEKKHYYDRPYLLTGSYFNNNTPFFGDIGNATLGNLIKPVKEMHPEYWGNPVDMVEYAESQGQRPDAPIVTTVSPGGRMTNEVPATPSQYGAEMVPSYEVNSIALQNIQQEKEYYAANNLKPPSMYFASSEMNSDGSSTGGYVVQDIRDSTTIYVPPSIAQKNIPIPDLFSMAGQGEPVVATKPRGLMDQSYQNDEIVKQIKLMNVSDPRSLNWTVQEAWENWTEPLGVYKWAAMDEILGYNAYAGKTVIQKADTAYNPSNSFWETELGSLGKDFSEIGRRFLRRDDGQLDKYNPIRNTMPDWMPGGGYFINFQTGDPYSKVPHGEYRLPGEAYEVMNPLHSDETGRYGAFDKFKILADVAPWSDEYKFWKDYVEDNLVDEELRKQAVLIKKQVSKRKKKYEFYDYRFADADVEKKEVTIKKFLDDYTFLTEEMGDTPIRLAGVEYRKKAEGVMQEYFNVGDTVTIGINADPLKQESADTYNTVRAVVYKGLKNVNQDIIQRGLMVENQTDFSAAAVHARFTPEEIAKGTRWEKMAHLETPFNTKFMHVRTAVEEYERDQVYGKDWATWQGFMVNDYLVPGFQSDIRDGFAEAVLRGAATGAVLGLFLGGGKRIKWAALGSAAVHGAGNIYKSYYEYSNEERWVPERRRKENEINEYFDILKYMKFSGLYEQAKEEAARMGYDVESVDQMIAQQKSETQERRRQLNAEKKRLFIDQPRGWEDRRKEINQELTLIQDDKDQLVLPEEVLQALKYKEQRDTTLYSIDPYGDRMELVKAFPYKDKWFVDSFINAGEEERKKILELVPENERRIYKAIWGMGLDQQKPLEEYFKNYKLPDKNWIGWSPDVDLEDYKVKAVQEAGLDLSDFNYWEDDVQAASMLPALEGGNDIHQDSFTGYREMSRQIREVLEGQGLRDVDIKVIRNTGESTRVQMNYREDRSREIDEYLKHNMEDIVQ